jgi:glyoxylase-like metal-dependent hydrolase (beta-lactamase superfamily II)
MYGVIPRTQWSRRAEPDGKSRCLMALNVALIRSEDRVILIDTGAGKEHPEMLKAYDFMPHRSLVAALAHECGITPEQVTDVVLTHLHFDHAGGTISCNSEGKRVPAFPQARHWVGRTQWEHAWAPNLLDDDSYLPQDLQLLQESVDLRLLEENFQVTESFILTLHAGHTPGQLVAQIREEGQWFLFVGDTIPTQAHLSLRWISAYDQEPVNSLNEKILLLERACKLGAVVVFPHEPKSMACRIRKVSDFYKGQPVNLEEQGIQYISLSE